LVTELFQLIDGILHGWLIVNIHVQFHTAKLVRDFPYFYFSPLDALIVAHGSRVRGIRVLHDLPQRRMKWTRLVGLTGLLSSLHLPSCNLHKQIRLLVGPCRISPRNELLGCFFFAPAR